MTTRLLLFLQVRPAEARMVILVASLFASLQAGQSIGNNAADALFFLRFGVGYLPYMFMALGTANFFLSIAYAAGLGRYSKARFFTLVLLGLAFTLLVERAAILTGQPLLYPLLWLSLNAVSLILGIMLWNVAAQVCDTRQAKRLFSIFAAAGILGGVIGNLLTGSVAALLGTENLVVLDGILIVIGIGLIRITGRRYFHPEQKTRAPWSLRNEIREGIEVTRRSRLFRFIVVASILFSILFFSMSFPFSKQVAATFKNEAAIAGFLGLFSAVVTSITFLVSLLVANRLYAWMGVGNAVLMLPVTYLLGFVLWIVNFDMATAVAARLAQMVVLGGVASAAWVSFFNVIPPEKRSQVQAFESSLPSQIGVVLTGALLVLGETILARDQIFALGVLTALVTAYCVWEIRREYGISLVMALRSGLMDVFTDDKGQFRDLRFDSNARRTALAGLADEKATVRRLSADILGKFGMTEAVQPLTRALRDADESVRSAALDALALTGAKESIRDITACLSDPNASVRAHAVDALSALSTPSLGWTIPILNDPQPEVRARAAAAVCKAGAQGHAYATIHDLLNSTDPSARRAGLKALEECCDDVDASQVTLHLSDASAGVRLAAVQALTNCKYAVDQKPMAKEALIMALDDADARVRRDAGKALGAIDSEPDTITNVLYHGTDRAQEAALDALEGYGLAAKRVVLSWALDQIPRAARLRLMAAALEGCDERDSRAVVFLRELLRRREQVIEHRVLKATASFGTRKAIRAIEQGLASKDQETRAQALEALDTLADKRIARGLVPLFEENVQAEVDDARVVLRKLIEHNDAWIRALAVQAVEEMLTQELRTVILRAQQDPEPIVRQAAIAAIGQTSLFAGGENTETSQMLGTMERILFLRDVPIFHHLLPEDLKLISDMASERTFYEGDYLCRERETGDELYIIAEGQVRIAQQSNGAMQTLRTLQKGEQIGELAILCEQPRSASAIAEKGGVRTLVLSGNALQAILRDRPEVAMAMLASLAQRLSTA